MNSKDIDKRTNNNKNAFIWFQLSNQNNLKKIKIKIKIKYFIKLFYISVSSNNLICINIVINPIKKDPKINFVWSYPFVGRKKFKKNIKNYLIHKILKWYKQ